MVIVDGNRGQRQRGVLYPDIVKGGERSSTVVVGEGGGRGVMGDAGEKSEGVKLVYQEMATVVGGGIRCSGREE